MFNPDRKDLLNVLKNRVLMGVKRFLPRPKIGNLNSDMDQATQAAINAIDNAGNRSEALSNLAQGRNQIEGIHFNYLIGQPTETQQFMLQHMEERIKITQTEVDEGNFSNRIELEAATRLSNRLRDHLEQANNPDRMV